MKISIIGLGLIGASLATCLKASNAEATLIGYDQSEQATISALAKGTIDQAATTAEEAIADADMVILAVFVEAIPLGATGKMQKMTLRQQLKDYVLPTL